MRPVPELAIISTLNAKIFRCININRTEQNWHFSDKKILQRRASKFVKIILSQDVRGGSTGWYRRGERFTDWQTDRRRRRTELILILTCLSLETSEVWTVCCRPGRIVRALTPWTRVRLARISVLQVQRLGNVRWVSMKMVGNEFKEKIFYSDSFLDKTLEKTLTTQILFCCRISAPKKMN